MFNHTKKDLALSKKSCFLKVRKSFKINPWLEQQKFPAKLVRRKSISF